MPAAFLLVDGYNLMHAAGFARRRYGPGELEACRNRFVEFVASRLTPAEKARTTIVFDANDAPANVPSEIEQCGVLLVYATQSGDADELLERMVAGHSAPRRIALVSSDRRLRRAVRTRRGKSVASDEFVDFLNQRGEVADEDPEAVKRESHPKYTGETSSTETEHWLEVFGTAPEAVRDAASDAEPTEQLVRHDELAQTLEEFARRSSR